MHVYIQTVYKRSVKNGYFETVLKIKATVWLQRSVFQAFSLQIVVLIWHMAAGICH